MHVSEYMLTTQSASNQCTYTTKSLKKIIYLIMVNKMLVPVCEMHCAHCWRERIYMISWERHNIKRRRKSLKTVNLIFLLKFQMESNKSVSKNQEVDMYEYTYLKRCCVCWQQNISATAKWFDCTAAEQTCSANALPSRAPPPPPPPL